MSRNPLTPDDIEALISTAIQLHARALEQQKEKRWWLPLALAVIGFAGAIIGGLLKGQDLALEPRRYAPYPP